MIIILNVNIELYGILNCHMVVLLCIIYWHVMYLIYSSIKYYYFEVQIINLLYDRMKKNYHK